MTRLSEHFSLAEMTHSQTADRDGIDNTPGEVEIDNLRDLCINVLEPIREVFGPIIVTSGYRCLALNKAIGSSINSQHIEGRAADIILPNHRLETVINWAIKNTAFDQAIREFPPRGWIHISFDPARDRRQGMLATAENGRTVYKLQGVFS